MRLYGCSKRRIGCLVWRVAKEPVPLQCIVFGGPLGILRFRSRRCHRTDNNTVDEGSYSHCASSRRTEGYHETANFEYEKYSIHDRKMFSHSSSFSIQGKVPLSILGSKHLGTSSAQNPRFRGNKAVGGQQQRAPAVSRLHETAWAQDLQTRHVRHTIPFLPPDRTLSLTYTHKGNSEANVDFKLLY